MRAQYIAGASGIALGACFTDADNGKKPGAARRDGLGVNRCIGLAMIAASFGMSDDHGRGPGIPQHLGGNIPGICARGLGVAVLATDRDARSLRLRSKAGDERRRRTDDKVDRGKGARTGNDFFQLRDRGFQPVHFPVCGN